jgi:hypothetical protein
MSLGRKVERSCCSAHSKEFAPLIGRFKANNLAMRA